MQLIATCPEETKPALVLELEALGARDIVPGYRAVAFGASEALFYELHLKLRTASRILKVIKDVPAKSPEMLRSQVRRIHWDELFDARHGFMVDAQGDDADKGGMARKQIITQVRESIREVFERAQGVAPVVDRSEPKVVVVAHLRHGRCMLSFDTSGKSLHKRGYREQGHPAPLKETLSAAILIMAGYDGSQAFMDPMCGSGTIVIEAAMMAVHKAPQIHRKKGEFHFEWLKDFDRDLWRVTQDRVRAEKLAAPTALVVGSDINAAYVAMAKKSALDARVEKYMTFNTGRFQDAEPPAKTGILVTNLPYGERIGSSEGDIVQLYEEVGDTLKQKFSGWQAAILAAAASPYRAIGLKPKCTISLMNGSIPCKLLLFDLYAGTRRAPRSSPAL
ncbi:THUMP domain-containing class I SAM-dependent RNA methyltransferase [Povalibacter sp.]|uniref:THUMP domain-containing class I SAM-dependent RNA methyltransferase n=1 Tax=Povalibacter sp. TaxID=1962978 RepID=UPI002F4089AA